MRHGLAVVLCTEGQRGAWGSAKVSVGGQGHWLWVSYEGLGWPWQQLCESVDAITELSGTRQFSHPSYLFCWKGIFEWVLFLQVRGLAVRLLLGKMCRTRWGSCAESLRGRCQLTQAENSHSKVIDGTLHQIHSQAITLQLTGSCSPGQEAKSASNKKKYCLLRHGITKMRGFSPGLTTGGKIKSWSNLPVITNEWLKRASRDFPPTGEQTPGPVHRYPSSLLLSVHPFFLWTHPHFSSDVFIAVYSRVPQLGGASVITPMCSKTQGLTGIKQIHIYTVHTTSGCIACFEISRGYNSGFAVPQWDCFSIKKQSHFLKKKEKWL